VPEGCFLADVDGEPVRVHGDPAMSGQSRDALAEVARAVRAVHAAEEEAGLHPVAWCERGPLDGRALPLDPATWHLRGPRHWGVAGYAFTGYWTERDGRALPRFEWRGSARA
jgi:hypothetical protein